MQQVLDYLEEQLARELQAARPQLYHVSIALGIVEKALVRKEGSAWPEDLAVSLLLLLSSNVMHRGRHRLLTCLSFPQGQVEESAAVFDLFLETVAAKLSADHMKSPRVRVLLHFGQLL